MSKGEAILLAIITVWMALFFRPHYVEADTSPPQPARYLVADYSIPNTSYRSMVYWFEPDKHTECYATETRVVYGNGVGHGGGISCLRK